MFDPKIKAISIFERQWIRRKAEIDFRCFRNLKDKDVFSKSDPLCVVGIKETANGAFSEIGRTECVQNCLSPEFATKIRVKYKFERVQILLFEL
jgi:hypothetical protein